MNLRPDRVPSSDLDRNAGEASRVPRNEKEVVAVFPFRNSGKDPVTITSATTSCNCTTVELAKTTYAPGEAGELKAFFEIGGRVGHQEKSITLATSEGPQGYASLTLEVEIRELVTCTPRVVIWHRGEKAMEKFVELVADPAQKIAQVTASPSLPSIAARIEVMEPGKRCRLWLKPASTENDIAASVTCDLQIEGRGSLPLTVFASVN